jgi:predicted  nucleic acid-binding Zn-ribbon protein
MSTHLTWLRNRGQQLTRQLSDERNELATQRRRRDDLSRLIRDFSNTVRNNVSTINTRIQRAESSLIDGVNHSAQNAQIQDTFRNGREGEIGTDSHLTDANRSIQQELTNVENRITALENQIRNTERQIRDNDDAIRRERQRIASQSSGGW